MSYSPLTYVYSTAQPSQAEVEIKPPEVYDPDFVDILLILSILFLIGTFALYEVMGIVDHIQQHKDK